MKALFGCAWLAIFVAVSICWGLRVLARESRIVLRETADQLSVGFRRCRRAKGLLRELEILLGAGVGQVGNFRRLHEARDEGRIGRRDRKLKPAITSAPFIGPTGIPSVR